MKHLKVKLWGEEIGRLVWNSATRRIYFMYNPDLNNIPDIAPLLSSAKNRNNLLPIYGDERPLDDDANSSFSDTLGRTIDSLSLSVNSKGHIDVSAIINGKRHRKFIRPNMEIYSDLMKQDIFNLPLQAKIRLVETLFLLE